MKISENTFDALRVEDIKEKVYNALTRLNTVSRSRAGENYEDD